MMRNNLDHPIHPRTDGCSNFSKWFDDSVVVDGSGRPLVMYHGTTFTEGGLGDVTSFNRKFTSEHLRRRQNLDMIGSWFSSKSDQNGAGKYADGPGAIIMPVYLRIKNPRIYRTFDELLDEWCDENTSRYIPKIDRQAHKANKWHGSADEFVNLITHEGYDGIRILPHSSGRSSEFAEQDVFLVFEGHQVKSALGNSGLFLRESSCLIDQSIEKNDLKSRAALAFAFVDQETNATKIAKLRYK